MKLLLLLILILSLPITLAGSQLNPDQVESMIQSYEIAQNTQKDQPSSPEEIIAIIKSPGFSETLKPQLVSQMNEGLAQAPKPIKMIVGNEKINVYLGEEKIVGYEFSNAQVKDIYPNGIDNPTLDLILDKSLLKEKNINPIKALSENKIQIKPVSLFKKIKFGTLKFGLNIFSKFSKED